MTHPPGGPVTPPPPSGPRAPKHISHPLVERLDPDSPEGQRIAADLSQVLAEIEMQIQQRHAAQQAA